MRAGNLKNIITIQDRAETTDEYGGPVYSWADYATVWAGVEPLSGRELIAAAAAQSTVTTRFRIRYRDDITSAMRILHNGKKYNIFAVIDINEDHKELVIMASSVVNEN